MRARPGFGLFSLKNLELQWEGLGALCSVSQTQNMIFFHKICSCNYLHIDSFRFFGFGLGLRVPILRNVIPYRDNSMNLHGTAGKYSESLDGC